MFAGHGGVRQSPTRTPSLGGPLGHSPVPCQAQGCWGSPNCCSKAPGIRFTVPASFFFLQFCSYLVRQIFSLSAQALCTSECWEGLCLVAEPVLAQQHPGGLPRAHMIPHNPL